MRILYLIYNKELKAFKIGVGDILGNRYKSHKRQGWVLVKYWYFADQQQALRVEKTVLTELRKLTKSTHYLNKEDMPQHGYTETFNAGKLSRRKVVNLINRVISAGI
jgi:predicted GIY-YIG superfamily endonuclease